jgi:spore germination cell wall hydrolase CwlJ-like protein
MIDNIACSVLGISLLLVTSFIPYTYYKVNNEVIGVVYLEEVTNPDNAQIQCLATNIYFEARNQTDEGMYAVANVVINRVNNSKWPDTICGVIYDRCQFSWNCSKNRNIDDIEAYEKSYKIAQNAFDGNVSDNTNGSTYYHAKRVSPYWISSFKKTARIGDHIFYKDRTI